MARYLDDMTLRLAAGLGQLAERERQTHIDYLRNLQQPDGGFAGREGGSDLYYTSFALRSLAILGELYGPLAERACRFLATRLSGRESIVDFLSLVYSASLLRVAAGLDLFADLPSTWPDAIAAALAKLRRPDGGYAKGPEGVASSTYHTFLVAICLELIDRPVPEPAEVVRFIHSQQCEGGGFREIRAGKRAGTNPTAAAIGTLRVLDALTPDVRESTLDFLVEMQNDEGGLRANTRIPIADLLSSFTGYLTLADLQATTEIDRSAFERYVRSLELPGGGFHGAAWDPACDVEYTFYGLGCRALVMDSRLPYDNAHG
ncbi:MAG: prenyltransferase/squalene oxidase repeat-containing protein [Planctomycetota bacterium]